MSETWLNKPCCDWLTTCNRWSAAACSHQKLMKTGCSLQSCLFRNMFIIISFRTFVSLNLKLRSSPDAPDVACSWPRWLPSLRIPTYGIQAAERGVQGSVWAFDADDGSLGVGGVVTGQGLMVRVGGLSVRAALRRRIGASVAGDWLLAAWPRGGRGGVSTQVGSSVVTYVFPHVHTHRHHSSYNHHHNNNNSHTEHYF